MRFAKIKIRGLGPFGEAELDLDAVDGELVQLAGANGAGKSTCLELLPGALYRQCPTRGSLASLATSRDAYVEVEVVNGQRYTIRQTVDANTGKGEALILDAEGQPVVGSAKRRDADRWIASHFPSPDVLYASSVSVQGRRGFLDLTAGERKSVLLRALRIDYLERQAERARDRARAARDHVASLRARLAEVPEPDLEALERARDGKRGEAEAAGERTRAARVALDRARAAAGDVARARELAEQRRAAERRLEAAREALGDVDRRLANNRRLLDEADAIRAAEAEAARLDEACARVAAELALVEREAAAADADERVAREAVASARREHEAAARAIDAVRQRASDLARAKQARDNLDRMLAEGLFESIEARAEAAQAEVARLDRLAHTAKDARIDGLRTGLGSVLQGCFDLDDARDAATLALEADDALASDAARAPADLEAARRAEHAAREAAKRFAAERAELERLAARAVDLEVVEAALKTAIDDDAVAAARVASATARVEEARKATNRVAGVARSHRDGVEALRRERAELDRTLAKAEPLRAAEARIAELTITRAKFAAAVEVAETELMSIPVVEVHDVDLEARERAVEAAARTEREAHAALAFATRALEAGGEAAARRASLDTQIDDGDEEVADWQRLAGDLGRDGLQALEIDAALPEISAIANDLLHECHGPRFTCELHAERTSADGKRSLEGLAVRVIDTVAGRDALAETYSGGECVIVGEALALALTTVACSRAGVVSPTLLRDETGAALDAENGAAYAAMLRRAARLIGAHKVLVVCHGSWLQADAVVRVEGGRLVV